MELMQLLPLIIMLEQLSILTGVGSQVFFNAKGTFTNKSSITIKSLGPLPKLISGPTGTFVNNTYRYFKWFW